MKNNTNFVKILTSIIFIGLLGIFCFYAFSQAHSISLSKIGEQTSGTERKFNVLVACTSREESFGRQIFRGAQAMAQKYDATIEFYMSDSQSDRASHQMIFDYASYIEADGVIAVLEGAEDGLSLPCLNDGSPIPMVTVGHYNPDLSQISYIGINYSELGVLIGNEILSSVSKIKNVCILYPDFPDNQNYSILMDALLELTNKNNQLVMQNVFVPQNSSSSGENFYFRQLADSEFPMIVVSLTEETTVLAAQTALDMNLTGKVRIIGFSHGAESRNYYEKGIISELILVNSLEIGKQAVEEIFEYKKNGYANSYIVAGIDILKKGGAL